MTDENGNVVPIGTTPSGSPGNGGSGNVRYGERLTRIEAKMDHVALKEDVLALKVWILSSVIAGMVSAIVITIGIIKIF